MSNPIWEDDHMCFACGARNPAGLHLQFSPWGENGLQCEFTPGKIYQGYKDVVHGGIVGLLLDEVMVNLPWKKYQQPVVSAEIRIRLHRPAPVGETLICRAELDGEAQGRLIPVRAQALNRQGRLLASAWAKCLRIPAVGLQG